MPRNSMTDHVSDNAGAVVAGSAQDDPIAGLDLKCHVRVLPVRSLACCCSPRACGAA